MAIFAKSIGGGFRQDGDFTCSAGPGIEEEIDAKGTVWVRTWRSSFKIELTTSTPLERDPLLKPFRSSKVILWWG
jgi:hypothetical protein